MIRISKIILYITVTVLLGWLLPWCYGFVSSTPGRTPFTLYSTVVEDFVLTETGEKEALYRDARGRTFTRAEYDSILPMMFYRQLLNDGRFPDSIKGMELNVRIAQTENFMFRSTPRNINTTSVPLYPLLESRSKRVDLEMPDDVFRIDKKGITFIDCQTNSVKPEKSEQFTTAMQQKGFTFPADVVAGNPTNRKEYDEGYLVTDAQGKLFHLKQTVGRPYVRAIDLPAGVEIAHMFVTEYRGRHFLGFIHDKAGNLYTLQTETYDLKKVDLPALDLKRQNVMINGNVFDWTVQVNNQDGSIQYYAVDADSYKRIREMEYAAPGETRADRAEAWLFPFEITFRSGLTTWIFPHFSAYSHQALVLGIVLAIGFCVVYRRTPWHAIPQFLFVLLCGIYGFLALFFFSKRQRK